MSKSNWDKGFTSGAKAAREASANSVCTLCCDGCKKHGERVERERIMELLNEELINCYCETPLTHLDARIKETK